MSEFLPVILSNATLVVEDVLRQVHRGGGSRGLVELMCSAYRTRGVAGFLLSCKPAWLLQELQKSGAAHAALLEGAAEEDKLTSRVEPLLDALAAGDGRAAAKIAAGSSRNLKPDVEHADEFLYALLLFELLSFRSQTQLEARLESYEAEAVDELRGSVCRALIERDAAGFGGALEELAAERRRWWELGYVKGHFSEEKWLTGAPVFVEGLALARIGQSMGLQLASDIAGVSRICLSSPPISFEPDSWMQL